MTEFGSDLRRQREAHGATLEEIAEGTKVSVRYLQALENEEFSELPGGVFNKGIVRSYVKFLDLDENEWLDRFTARTGAVQSEEDWAAFAENVRRNRSGLRKQRDIRWLGIAAMVIVLAGCGWLVWRFVVQPRMEAAPVPLVDQGAMSSK